MILHFHTDMAYTLHEYQPNDHIHLCSAGHRIATIALDIKIVLNVVLKHVNLLHNWFRGILVDSGTTRLRRLVLDRFVLSQRFPAQCH